jgi:hypothetical protein
MVQNCSLIRVEDGISGMIAQSVVPRNGIPRVPGFNPRQAAYFSHPVTHFSISFDNMTHVPYKNIN